MVVLLQRALGAVLPPVEAELLDGVAALRRKEEPPAVQPAAHRLDAHQHPVVRRHRPKPPVFPHAGQKARRRRVDHHRLDPPVPGEGLQCGVVLLIGAADTGGAGVVPALLQAPPGAGALPPEGHRHRVHRAVVHADDIPVIRGRRRGADLFFLREHIVDLSLGGTPLPEDEPPVKPPGVHPLIPLPGLRGEAGVIRHGKVEVEEPPLLPAGDPLPVEPVPRVFRIAGEPVPGARHRTPGQGLLHKGAGHQRHLVKEDPCQGDALDQGGAGLVPAAEQAEGHLAAGPAHPDTAGAAVLLDGTAAGGQHPEEVVRQVAAQRADRLAAEGHLPARLAVQRPEGKGQGGAAGLARADGAVTEHRLVLIPCGRVPPPAEHLELFGRPAGPIPPGHRDPLPTRPAGPGPPGRRAPAGGPPPPAGHRIAVPPRPW